MKIKGEYRDILIRNGVEAVDAGWRSNTIVEDFGTFLSVLMKKDFKGTSRVGLDYIAFGSGSKDLTEFKSKIQGLLKTKSDLIQPKIQFLDPPTNKKWVWAKQIDPSSIKYLVSSQVSTVPTDAKESVDPTSTIKMDIVVGETEPSQDTLDFKEFGLFGVGTLDDGSPDPNRIYFINYVIHDDINKNSSMKLNRTIILKFF